MNTSPSARYGHRLARKPGSDEVHGGRGCDLGEVTEVGDVRVVRSHYLAGVLVNLRVPAQIDVHAGHGEAEFEAAVSGAEGGNGDRGSISRGQQMSFPRTSGRDLTLHL